MVDIAQEDEVMDKDKVGGLMMTTTTSKEEEAQQETKMEVMQAKVCLVIWGMIRSSRNLLW